MSSSAASTPANTAPTATATATAPAASEAPSAANGTTRAAEQGLAAALAQAPEGSADPRKNRDNSHQIDRQLEDDSKKFKKECKILLLGKPAYIRPQLT
jgi:guanine nucleotide-binding protein subunit alpha